jgi:hypothetical protein
MGEFGPRLHARNARFLMKTQKANRLALRFFKFAILSRAVSNWRLPPPILKTHFLKQF